MRTAQNTVSALMARDELCSYIPISIGLYPDNMPLISDYSTHFTQALVRPLTLTEFMASMFWVDSVNERGENVNKLVLPFVPGARQDRLNNSGDFLFTAKSIAKEINLRNFDEVVVLDPHSDVTPALIDRCKVWHSCELFKIVAALKQENYSGVISPDAGAEKRANSMARMLEIPLYHGWKTRDVSTGKISGFGVEELPYSVKKYLIVDDICDGGGTFVGLMEAIKEQQPLAQCDLFVTHGLFTKGVIGLLKYFNKICCTDSIPNIPNGVNVINVCTIL